VPALGGKIDAVPGQANHTWFRAEEEGVYEGQCGEFCGLNHSQMTMVVRAVAPGDYETELARFAGNGEEQFEAACAKCHNLEGPELIGPTLQGNPTLADPRALGELVRNGEARHAAAEHRHPATEAHAADRPRERRVGRRREGGRAAAGAPCERAASDAHPTHDARD
jgi:hypothetical protein